MASVAMAQNPKPIHLRHPFPTELPAPGIASQRSAASAKTTGLFVVQFHSPLQPEWRKQLAALGVTLIRYVPEDAFVAKFKNIAPDEIRALDFVQFVGAFRPEQKFDPRVQQRLAAADERVEVAVVLAAETSESDAQQAKGRFAQLTHETRLASGRILRGAISKSQLDSLAASDAVLWIEPAPRMKLFDEVSSRIIAGDGPGNQTLMQSLGYDGSGVTVAVADSGLDSGDTNFIHPDIAGRVKALFYYGNPGQLEDAADEHSHGTHVAGIIAGNGSIGETDEDGFLYGLGVAPGASLIGQRLFDAAGNYAPPPSFETLTRDAKRAGADIGSNSWGDDTQGHYDVSAMEFDALVRDADLLALGDQPYILEFSAGNAGPNYQTIGSPAVAKNVIATGASQNDRFNLPIDEFAIYADGRDAMADFSSRGPCADGRIKPDLVAPGSWIASLRSIYANDAFAWWPISGNYLYQGGTSQAGPQVSGAAAIFVQYWRATRGGVTPSPALVKAALINSATDMDDGLTTDAVPNNDEGWGRVNLPALIASTRNYEFTDQTVLLTNGGVFEKRILIGSADEPLKITLTYTDVPGLPAAAIALVNDLDLEVIAPTGELFRGNRFSDGESIPNAPLPDTINNVEAVHLNAPVPGEYVIRVRGTRVVEDARRDSPAIDQDFALVVSGTFAAPGVGIVTFDRRVYRAPDQIELTLVDYDLAGQSSATVQLRSTTESAGEVVTLFAHGSHGVFTGLVAIVTGSATADGNLQVAHLDVIEARYVDALPAATRSFFAEADLLPPQLTGIHATNQFGQLTILWDTDELARGELYYGSITPNFAVTNFVFDFSQEFPLPNLPAGAAIQFYAVAQDEAGNRATNNNGGAFFFATNSQSALVLLVDSYTDFGGLISAPPLSGYTDALNAIGASYGVFDARAGSFPTLQQLQSYRSVIWRMDELIAPTPAQIQTIAAYVTNGGSLFIASMEAVTRLGEAGATGFVRDILQVQSHVEDVPVNEIVGFGSDPVGVGIDIEFLDYSPYEELLFILGAGGISDPSDWIAPTTNATPVLLADGEIVGIRSPRPGVDLPGRVVYLSFPLDAVPLGSGIGNNRAGLLKRALDFLAPPPNTSSITLDSDVYSLPGLAVVEVEDADLRGSGTVPVTIRSPQRTNELALTLTETARPGVFRGNVLFATTNSGAPGIYVTTPSDTIQAEYFDASAAANRTATATFDIVPPEIFAVEVEPGYLEAYVYWTTSKPADSLVQYGESPQGFPNNQVEYDAALTTEHAILLTGLKPDTTYYFRVTSRDRAGNTSTSIGNGSPYQFTTLEPFAPPWFDNLETNNTDWSVIISDESESGWTRGTPGGGESAYSGSNVWGSILDGGNVSQMESYLISPGILLTGGNKATLRFQHKYDFLAQGDFEIQLAAIEILTNITTAPVLLHQFGEDFSFGWEEFEIDLTPYLGNVVYIIWYHFLFSIDGMPRLGWLIDDVSITMETIVPGTIQVTNNLWQSVFALTGPSGRTGTGRWLAITNAAPGQYVIQFGDVAHYQTPPPQTNTLVEGGTITFTGNYTFTDANNNQLPDSYELAQFGSVDPERTATTDTDHDGLSDWAEFVAGTDPVNPPPPFRVNVQQLSSDTIRLSWTSITNHSYRIHTSTNGVHWTAGDLIAATGTNTTYTFSVVTNGPTKLFRVEALPSESLLAPTFRLTTTVLPNNQLRLSWPSAPGHGYRLLSSSDLVNWTPQTDWIRATNFTINHLLPAATNNVPAYFRLEAQP